MQSATAAGMTDTCAAAVESAGGDTLGASWDGDEGDNGEGDEGQMAEPRGSPLEALMPMGSLLGQ